MSTPPFQRIAVATPEPFRQRLGKLGLLEAGGDGRPYWETGAAYSIGQAEARRLLEAAETLHELCRQAIGAALQRGGDARFGVGNAAMTAAIAASWQAAEPPLYGRMDFSFAPDGTPKLLDYEADGPLGLPEASYLQWEWFEALPASLTGDASQENLVYEKLLEQWPRLGLKAGFTVACGGAVRSDGGPADTAERFTAEYLIETAREAGLAARLCSIEAVGWDGDARCFTDEQDRAVATLVKLYPWLWMEQEPNVECLGTSRTALLPAAWTRLLADKALLALLWESAPDCPYLLPASLDPAAIAEPRVAKPCHGGDGVGVALPGQAATTVEGAMLYQRHCPLPVFDDAGQAVHAAVSVWLVGGRAAGLSFRESRGPVTDADARFLPHLLRSA